MIGNADGVPLIAEQELHDLQKFSPVFAVSPGSADSLCGKNQNRDCLRLQNMPR